MLIDDVIDDLKSNDTSKAQIHLNILNQQLSTFVNSTSLQSVKVLLVDVGSYNTDTGTCTNIVRHEYDNAQMFQKFVSATNSQYNYNKDGVVRAIPIIVYHTLVNYRDLSDSSRPIDTTVNLFDVEMRYLYDNGFKVLTMSDLGYDANNKSVYIKGVQQ